MKRLLLSFVAVLTFIDFVDAQDIKVKSFERNYTSLIASTNPEYDNTGEACAVIRFYVRDSKMEIEPNLGVVKREERAGEVRLWVPVGTKRLTIRKQGMIPLRGYELPMVVESKVTYDAVVEIKEKQMLPKNRVYAGLGYNIVSISGPYLTFGVDFSNHVIELNAIYGLNKTEDWNFFDESGNVIASYNYQALRVGLRYGYDLIINNFVRVMPQIGVAYNIMNGKTAAANIQNNNYKNANSFSASIGARVSIALSNHFGLQITPEYDFGLSKDKNCKLISENDNSFKNWTDGFNINAGLLVYF